MKLWGQATKGRSNGSPVAGAEAGPAERNSEVTFELDTLLAEEAAERTKELLDFQGWCLWQCSTLGGEIIAVVRDETMEGVPEGYPVYTEAELESLWRDDVSEAALRLVHEAKKLAGANIISKRE